MGRVGDEPYDGGQATGNFVDREEVEKRLAVTQGIKVCFDAKYRAGLPTIGPADQIGPVNLFYCPPLPWYFGDIFSTCLMPRKESSYCKKNNRKTDVSEQSSCILSGKLIFSQDVSPQLGPSNLWALSNGAFMILLFRRRLQIGFLPKTLLLVIIICDHFVCNLAIYYWFWLSYCLAPDVVSH